MPGRHIRNQMGIEELRKKVWDLYLNKNLTQSEIGELTGRSQRMINYHIKSQLAKIENENLDHARALRKHQIEECIEWRDRAVKDYNSARRAWQRSIGKILSVRKKGKRKVLPPAPGKTTPREAIIADEAIVYEEERAGDPKLFMCMMAAQEQIRRWSEKLDKLCKLYEQKASLAVPSGMREIVAMTDAQLIEEIRKGQLFAQIEGMKNDNTVTIIPTEEPGNGNGNITKDEFRKSLPAIEDPAFILKP